ncbi:MAG: hypothetical protein ACXW5U_22490 [Thermoanaerobaculia bacterium]
MAKTVKLAFTGVVCLQPAYAGTQEVNGPILAILPCSPSARHGSNGKTQVDAHFVFAAFQDVHLVQDQEKKRLADHKVVNVHGVKMSLCILHNERLTVTPSPQNQKVRFDLNGNSSGVPKPGYTHVEWIPRWEKFASGREAKLKDLAGEKIHHVSVSLPAGDVAAGFVCPLTPKVQFQHGTESARFYAQEIAVTLSYPDATQKFVLASEPVVSLVGAATASMSAEADIMSIPRPTDLEFTWGTNDEIEITIGNGSLASIDSVLNKGCGHEHRGKIDYEFEIIYDAVSVNDPQDKKPVPEVKNSEIRQIPCIATMI